MEQEQEFATREQLEQLGRALYVISRPALRRAFLSDPLGTLKEHGAGDLPRELVDVLADMTYEQLSVVARLYDDECEAGLFIGRRLDGGSNCVL